MYTTHDRLILSLAAFIVLFCVVIGNCFWIYESFTSRLPVFLNVEMPKNKLFHHNALDFSNAGRFDMVLHKSFIFSLLSHESNVYFFSEDNQHNDIISHKPKEKSWIIVINDDKSLCTSIGNFLFSSGYEITACVDAFACLQLITIPYGETCKFRVPDVLICDIKIQSEFLKLFQTLPQWKVVPVLILITFTEERMEGYRAGADVVLKKTFEERELLSIVNNLMKRKRKRGTMKVKQICNQYVEMKAVQEWWYRNVKKCNNCDMSRIEPFRMIRHIHLTPMEQHILQLFCQGYRNVDIAKERSTVSTIGIGRAVSRLYEKAGIKTREELITWATHMGYV